MSSFKPTGGLGSFKPNGGFPFVNGNTLPMLPVLVRITLEV